MNKSFFPDRDERVIDFLTPVRIVASEKTVGGDILLRPCAGQATTRTGDECILQPGGCILLDFGREIHGGLCLVTGDFPLPNQHLRVTFGESVSETGSHPDYKHAIQEGTVELPPYAATDFGELGFRFVRLENIETERPVRLCGLRGRFVHRDLRALASFECSDPLLNRIWDTSVSTVGLCLQSFAWDGIKRDRLVWMGDLYPELLAAGTVFGRLPVLEKSLDFLRDETPLPDMMNGCATYSIWWIWAHHAWFRRFGAREYLEKQREYLCGLLRLFAGMVGEHGEVRFTHGWLLLDWATGTREEDAPAIRAGCHALLLMAFRHGAELCRELGENGCAAEAETAAAKMASFVPPLTPSAAANAFQVLAGLRDAGTVYGQCFAPTLPHGLSTFLGCFVLDACALAGHRAEALHHLRAYWGGMLSLGATTFWEHFDIDWLENAARIDEPVPPEKRDIHRDCGEGCYRSFRHSLCHGWASLPAEWLIRQILGASVLRPDHVSVMPSLCGLEWARGVVPTLYGDIRIEAAPDKVAVHAPPEVQITRGTHASGRMPEAAP